MPKDMAERFKKLQEKKETPANLQSSVEETFKNSADVPKKQTKKWTFNMDAGIYRKLRQEAFDKETDMTSLVNAYLRQAIR